MAQREYGTIVAFPLIEGCITSYNSSPHDIHRYMAFYFDMVRVNRLLEGYSVSESVDVLIDKARYAEQVFLNNIAISEEQLGRLEAERQLSITQTLLGKSYRYHVGAMVNARNTRETAEMRKIFIRIAHSLGIADAICSTLYPKFT